MVFVGARHGMSTLRTYQSNGRNDDVTFLYNCGEKSLTIPIDELFDGTR